MEIINSEDVMVFKIKTIALILILIVIIAIAVKLLGRRFLIVIGVVSVMFFLLIMHGIYSLISVLVSI